MDPEKRVSEQLETLPDEGGQAVSSDFIDDPRVAAIKRKVDLRLCLILSCLYVINQIDRSNLGVAMVAGMGETLSLTSSQYSIVVLVFFPTYVALQPVSTVLCRKIGPRIFITGLVLGWGAVVTGMAFAHSWGVIAATRAILGLIEAGFFPSALFLLSMWYVRREVAKRNAVMYLVGNVASGFGGILAYGFSRMDGTNGLEGWRWIFVWEGVMSFIAAIVGYMFIVDFPEDAKKSWKFLSSEECEIMIDRVDKDRRDAHVTPFSLKHYLSQALDWKVWFFASNFGLTAVVTYSVIFFLPIVLKQGLGFSEIASLMLPAPCYAFGGLLGYAEAWWSDKYNIRGPVLIFNAVIQIVGIAVLGYAANPSVRYFGAFLVTGASNANVPAAVTYQSTNIVGQWRRAFCNATIVGAGGIGGIVGSLAFRTRDAPDYRPGLYCCFVAAALTIVSVTTTSVYMIIKNKMQAQGRTVIEGVEGFRYTI